VWVGPPESILPPQSLGDSGTLRKDWSFQTPSPFHYLSVTSSVITMSVLFCCSSISPYRPRLLEHEAKFRAFMSWASLHKSSVAIGDGSASTVNCASYAVQLVRQVNYGPQESIRYFVPSKDSSDFTETTEDNLIESNFEKLNSYLTNNTPSVRFPS
jgi:hypothetical protein